ncbi:hypothetical protein EGW08_009559 [Elysia chlorotica]|uniref:Transmembrane protein 26 n=1 Tax=Elysia chlorotica TaxID=188477 RepID=A0A3S1B8Z3_ELYCH|nr:hypothetical protein EGW08_009559 [Elysia chlorotica]
MAPKALMTVTHLARDYVSYYKAIFARTLFGTHAVVAVWRTTVLMGVQYWALCFGVVCLCVEYIVTMWANMGEEWPWISPSTLCYLATVGSSLWVQKLQSLGHVIGTNGSSIATVPSTTMELDFSPADWLLLTEQTMMVTIILSRWLLPKGEMTHTALSSLLLLYLGLSADILDFSTIFNEPKVAADEAFCYVLLTVWTGSLFQFFLVLTATKKAEDEEISLKSIVCSSEVWQILVQVGLQDFPYLIIRLTVMLNYQVFNYTIIFFVCKNSLVIALEVNHMIGLCQEQRAKLKRRQARVRGLKNKLTSAKNAIVLAGKSPFNLKKLRENGAAGANGDQAKKGNIALSLAGAAFAAKGAAEAGGVPPSPQATSEDGSSGSQADKRLTRIGSNFSGSSDDGYATAAEGVTSRPVSTESLDKTAKVEHISENPDHTNGSQIGNAAKPKASRGLEKTKPAAKLAITTSQGPVRNKTGAAPSSKFAKLAGKLNNNTIDSVGIPGVSAGNKQEIPSSESRSSRVSGAGRSSNTSQSSSGHHNEAGETHRRGTPPLDHFMTGSSTFSLLKINTTDNSTVAKSKVFRPGIFGRTDGPNESVF